MEVRFPAAVRTTYDRFPGLRLPLAYGIVLLWISPLHGVFDEWGGVMQYFSGKEILAGKGYAGWASGFWPPLYSFLLGLGSSILPGFQAGKLISVMAGATLLYVAYEFSQELAHDRAVALWTQVFLLLTPLYVHESLMAHNHILDALFFIWGLLLFLKALRSPSLPRFLAAGLVCGLAGLTRYTSYVLFALPAGLFLFLPDRKRAGRMALAFWAVFSLVNLPWWIENTLRNGFPFHTMEYLNSCVGMFRYEWRLSDLGLLWRCDVEFGAGGLAALILAHPLGFFVATAERILQSMPLLMKEAGILGPFLVPALLEGFVVLKTKEWAVVYGQMFLYVAFASLGYVPEYGFLCWTVVTVTLGLMLVSRLLGSLQATYSLAARSRLRGLSMALLVVLALATTDFKVRSYASAQEFEGPLVEVEQVARALRKHDPDIANKVIMAIDPGRAYYAGSEYLETPPQYDGTVSGLVTYEGIDDLTRKYAPKYPSAMPSSTLEADYLVYTRTPPGTPYWDLQELPQFSFLLDPRSQQIPPNFNLVYQSPNVVVYEID